MDNIFTGIVWKFIEKTATQFVSFIVSVVLARILMPEQYGIIAKVTIFIAIADVFVTTGLGSALIQNKESDELDFSSMFYLNMVLSNILYIILFFIAPYVALFFDNEILSPVLRILGIRLLFSACGSIQQAYISKHMIFKKSAKATFMATVCSAVLGIGLAYGGAGVWSLVVQQLSLTICQIIFQMFIVDWKPSFKFSWKRAKRMVGYSNTILLSGILDSFGSQIRTLLIGKFYTDAELAYFNRGDVYPQMLINSINNTMHVVLFAVYSKEQDYLDTVKNILRKSIQRGSFLVFTMLTGLAMVARPLILFMLTEKWEECVPFLQIACVGYATWIIQIVSQEAIMGLGYGKDYLRITIARFIFNMLVLILAVRLGIIAIAISTVITNLFSMALVCAWTAKHLNYRIAEQIKDILPSIEVSVGIVLVVYAVSYLNIPNIILLVAEVASGIGICILISIVTKNESFYWILSKIKLFLRGISER